MGRKLVLALGVVAAMALPASAAAKQPTNTDKRHAAKECKAERGTDAATQEAFKAKYGNFGKCVSARAKEEQAERRAARTNAARECRAERDEIGVDAFREKYGTNRNKRNAFGKCVSQKAKAEKAEQDGADKKNAFGKCVSGKSGEEDGGRP